MTGGTGGISIEVTEERKKQNFGELYPKRRL